jgi:hypothetical protein
MLPDTVDTPATTAQKGAYSFIPGAIAANFGLPVGTARLGHTAVPAAAMPETSVDENGEPGMSKNEIRPTWQSLISAPAGNSGGAKKGNELQLRGFVTTRANGSHYLRTFGF